MPRYSISGVSPTVPEAGNVWIAPDAQVVGDVRFGTGVSVWFSVVIRADNEPMVIGDGTNIQDGSILHSDPGSPLTIGANVTVGHRATLHGCTIADNSLIGMGSTILNGARIGRNCIVGAGALVTERKVFPDGSLIVGSPAKVVRPLTADEIAGIGKSAAGYVANGERFAETLQRLD